MTADKCSAACKSLRMKLVLLALRVQADPVEGQPGLEYHPSVGLVPLRSEGYIRLPEKIHNSNGAILHWNKQNPISYEEYPDRIASKYLRGTLGFYSFSTDLNVPRLCHFCCDTT